MAQSSTTAAFSSSSHRAASETTPLLQSLPPIAIADSETSTLYGTSEEDGLLAGSDIDAKASSPSNLGNGYVNHDDEEEEDVPLPRGQMFFLCVARVVEPIAFFGIFPFVNQMIWDLGRGEGMKEGDVGFYSGLIVCLSLSPFTVFLVLCVFLLWLFV